ncbi:MAG: DNA translocase FtsK [Nitrospiria bacterium]
MASKKADFDYMDEVSGTLLVALGLLIGVSLLTYHPEDPSFLSISSSSKVQNAVGKVGAQISALFFQLFGIGSYFFPLFLTALGVRFFKKLEGFFHKKTIAGGLLWVLTLSALAHLEWLGFSRLDSLEQKGGILGRILSQFLLGNLASFGTAVVLFSLFMMGGILLFSFSPQMVLKQCNTGFQRIRRWGVGAVSKSGMKRGRKSMPSILNGDREKDSGDPPEITNPPPRIAVPPKQETFTFATEDAGDYRLPPISLLSEPSRLPNATSKQELIVQSQILERKLRDFDVEGRVTQVHPGPVITMFEFEPAPGVKLNRIINLSDDLALAMRALHVRIVAPLPGKAAVGIEIPNHKREEVGLKEIFSSPSFNRIQSKLRLALGKDIFGSPLATDLATMPHLLIAGSTGSGKSVGLNSMVLSILFSATPAEVKMVMIDPKMLEFSLYDGIPHLVTPVIVRPKAAADALKRMVAEMQHRYQLLAEKGVRNIDAYNKRLLKEKSKKKKSMLNTDDDESGDKESPLPYIVIFIDELADLMMVASRDVEDSIARLAQMARAAGIHLILATQRPSVDVLTGLIKANFPARIAFCVSSKTDSRTILDANGAEQLLGKGDMLYLSAGTGKLVRVHGSYVSEEEVKKVVGFIKEQGSPLYDASFTAPLPSEDPAIEDDRDEFYERARELVIGTGHASASFIQRRMRVGYPRAARIIEMMEEDGLIGPAVGAKPREILIRREEQPL